MPADSFTQRTRALVEEFSSAGDAIDRYRRLVAMGEAMPRMEPSERSEENRLPGCQYDLWMLSTYEPDAGVLRLRADSDAKITRGLAAVLVRVFDALPPTAILDADLGFLDEMGLRDQLSVHRNNGLSALLEELRARARQYGGGPADDGGPADASAEASA